MIVSKIRAFIAIAISESVREKIAGLQENLKKHQERISWTKPGNIHLTLKFLGDIEESKIKLIGESLTTAIKEFQPFKFWVNNLGAFPNLMRPRILWVNIDNPGNELSEIQNSIEEQLNQLGFPKEKKRFNPHLTIGRVKLQVSDQFIERFKTVKFDGDEVKVEEIIFMKSKLDPKGAIYTPLKKLRLEQALN